MFSKLKVFFLVATCSLSLGLGFLLPVLPNQKTTLAVDSKLFDAKKYAEGWEVVNKQKIFSELKNSHSLLPVLFSELPELVVKDSEGNSVIYKIDLVASAFRAQMRAQQKSVYDSTFDWNQVSKSVQNQILQFYEKDAGFKKDDDLKKTVISIYGKLLTDFWNTIQYLLYQMKVLDVSKYQDFLGKESSFTSPASYLNEKWDYFKEYTFDELKKNGISRYISLISLLVLNFTPGFIKTALNSALTKEWLPKLQLLQSAPGLASLRVDKEDVDVSSLTSSDAQSIADLNKNQTDTLAKFKETIPQKLRELVATARALRLSWMETIPQKLRKLVAPQIKHLINYKKTIQTSLNLFAKYGITNPNLKGTEYDLSELLTPENLNKLVVKLFIPAFQQLGNLYKVTPRIGSHHFTTAFAPIKTYKDNIQPSLDSFAQHDIIAFTLNEVNYQLNHLLDTNNLGKPAADLSPAAAKQLGELYDNGITSEQLQNEVSTVLEDRKTQVQKEKAPKQKAKETKKAALTIGLATSGGVLLLAGGAGGFLYWFYKIKK